VTFAYPGRPDLPALQGFGLRVRPGETVALVGPSGAGKSTVLRLLLRFYDPQAGRILLDGVDLKDADPGEVRARMALVAQDAALFSGSALDNIRFGREDATLEEVKAAARAAGMNYVHIPVVGSPTQDQVDANRLAIEDADGPVLAFCRSGTRSIVTWSLGQALSGVRTRSELAALGRGAGYDLSGVLG